MDRTSDRRETPVHNDEEGFVVQYPTPGLQDGPLNESEPVVVIETTRALKKGDLETLGSPCRTKRRSYVCREGRDLPFFNLNEKSMILKLSFEKDSIIVRLQFFCTKQKLKFKTNTTKLETCKVHSQNRDCTFMLLIIDNPS